MRGLALIVKPFEVYTTCFRRDGGTCNTVFVEHQRHINSDGISETSGVAICGTKVTGDRP
jgi:hypothetical protein